jgi:chemotaxis protein CheX
MNQSSFSSAKERECWLPTLQLATQEVFDLMLATPLRVVEDLPSAPVLDITSMVGLAGQLCGVLSVRCSAKSGTQMASRMLGIDAEKAGPEMWDAVGEICNMIAGNFKNKIKGLGDTCTLSVPTVITGSNYSVHTLVNDNLQTAFLFEGEPVVVCLEVHG